MSGPANRDGSEAVDVPLRVRYPETDRMGVAYHACYLTWFELGRTELIRGLGRSYAEVEEEDGIYLPVVEAGLRYRAPARYDEQLVVRTWMVSASATRVRFEYELLRPGDGKRLAEGFTSHAAVGRDGRPTRLSGDLRRRLEERGSRE